MKTENLEGRSGDYCVPDELEHLDCYPFPRGHVTTSKRQKARELAKTMRGDTALLVGSRKSFRAFLVVLKSGKAH